MTRLTNCPLSILQSNSSERLVAERLFSVRRVFIMSAICASVRLSSSSNISRRLVHTASGVCISCDALAINSFCCSYWRSLRSTLRRSASLRVLNSVILVLLSRGRLRLPSL